MKEHELQAGDRVGEKIWSRTRAEMGALGVCLDLRGEGPVPRSVHVASTTTGRVTSEVVEI